jgi:hypothetical protein
MPTFTQPEPLTDAELDRLACFLASCKGGKAMNMEELDGFFAALIAGPDVVMPSKYNREVFGGTHTSPCDNRTAAWLPHPPTSVLLAARPITSTRSGSRVLVVLFNKTSLAEVSV